MSRHLVAQAITREARRAAGQAQPTFRGIVMRVRPLKIDVLGDGDDELLLERDLDLTDAVRALRRDKRIKKGDTVLLMRDGDDWTVFDVLSGRMPPKGPKQVGKTYRVKDGYGKLRKLDPESDSPEEVARVLATLIDDLKASGALKKGGEDDEH